MPELPEVETVKRGLEKIIKPGTDSILKLQMGSKKLRMSPQLDKTAQVKGEPILGIKRVAKYLLFELDHFVLLSHLGMTGSWRLENNPQKHDHVRIYLNSGRTLTYNDPRRFGMFDILDKKTLSEDKRLAHLGLDPILDTDFNGAFLFQVTRKRRVPAKTLIMNQHILVGVGNIYASEALFMAGIHPLTLAEKLNQKQCDTLVRAIKDVLLEAIAFGGTTISDFRQAGGSGGYFQNFLLAYGRDKELCRFCNEVIASQMILGRNSFWCPTCQPLE